ncbi:hypothetical protein OPV22_008014 [Ensete ventricosum]|uniref:Xylanase inhibitor N-terminal domain-containing protein n=1 Tax=Ensete ventricosum TaxID=4639 RepID=A0AAV8RG05_ENSVE|nr:hypothetical protein OPV22_008014 [Ensete ventricosum]
MHGLIGSLLTGPSRAPRSKNCAALARHDRALRGRLLADACVMLSSMRHHQIRLFFVLFSDEDKISLSACGSVIRFLVEDVLYLMTEDETPHIVEAPIVFGCGDKQAGAFLDGAAQSFSMCFGGNGLGRINFGDKGKLGSTRSCIHHQQSTHPSFKINITGIAVGNKSTHIVFDAPVGSDTTLIQILLFKYCYELSLNQTSILLPEINLTTRWECLSYKSIYILPGHCEDFWNQYTRQNFLMGLHVVFDRERLILGGRTPNATPLTTPPALPRPLRLLLRLVVARGRRRQREVVLGFQWG